MLYIFLIVFIDIIFHTWFTFLPISAGDMGFFYKEQIVAYFNLPFMWEAFRNLGFGGESYINQGVYLYNVPLGILGRFIDYGAIERVIWFFPILIVGALSPLLLVKKLALFSSRFYSLAVFIYLLNTYLLMILGGGQLTVVFGYITIPLAFALFLAALQDARLSRTIFFSLVFSLLVFADFRYVYIFCIIIFIYAIFLIAEDVSKKNIVYVAKKYTSILFVSVFVVIGTQAYWLLPYLSHFSDPTTSVGSAYTSTKAVQYFSFAQFEESLSLLHPYWPENIFGKVGFMKPEFLLLPMLAFSALLFVSKKKNTKKERMHILFFAFLGLLGTFLGKGSNPPFGQLYLWTFHHIPGFIMFRDSTKWDTLVAVSYSVLIPFTVFNMYNLLQEYINNSKFKIQNSKLQLKIQKSIPNLFLLLATLYLLILISPAVLGQLGGTLQPVVVPQEYVDYKDFLVRQQDFFRVLWVPTTERFTYYSDIHPMIQGNYFFDSYDKYSVVKKLQNPALQQELQQAGVKYIAVPDDATHEIFLADGKYDDRQYSTTVAMLDKISWLHPSVRFGRIILFSIDHPKDHFWTNAPGLILHTTVNNPTDYTLDIKNAKIGDTVVFAETYDAGWVMQNGKVGRYAVSKTLAFNSFTLQKSGNFITRVMYAPQSLVPLAISISVIAILGTIGLSVFLMRIKK